LTICGRKSCGCRGKGGKKWLNYLEQAF
jgi:hypothetical protein